MKQICPEVTILRPTYMFNVFHMNTTIAGRFGYNMKMFNRMHWAIEGMDSKVQPVTVNDVTLAIINALKMDESIGQSYDLGGPHTYRWSEIYEQFFN